ncbi:MAG: DUF3891 family protein [Vicinamibacterales bacterium]
MIVRPAGSSQLLITQPDHAALSARIMRQWRAGGFPDAPRRSSILLAIEEHDNGWREVDAAPVVDGVTGRILDFVSAPDPIRRAVWPRGVDRLAGTPYAAALVAQHAVHIYRRNRDDPQWAPFFTEMEATRDRHLHSAGALSLDEVLREYAFVRIGDLASLTFCNGWIELQTDDAGYAIRLDGTRLTITPDPFEGRQIAIEIAARELPNRPFRSPSEAHAAFSGAREVAVTGIALGG